MTQYLVVNAGSSSLKFAVYDRNLALVLKGQVSGIGSMPQLEVDPDPSNKRAIRAYQKAGFVVFDERTSELGPALMMALDAPE